MGPPLGQESRLAKFSSETTSIRTMYVTGPLAAHTAVHVRNNYEGFLRYIRESSVPCALQDNDELLLEEDT